MAYTLEYRAKIFGSVTIRRPLTDRFLIHGIVTNRRPITTGCRVYGKVAQSAKRHLSKVRIFGKVKKAGYFSTMFTFPVATPIIPSVSEVDSFCTARVYLQLPEYSPTEKLIGYARVNEIGFDWGLNQEILWNLRLIDFDREILKSSSEYYPFFCKDGFYDADKKTRKFIKLEIRTWIGNSYMDFVLPRLVIKENPLSGNVLSFAGWDYITEVLTQDINLPTFCAMESLKRVDSTHYLSTSLTGGSIKELYSNYSPVDNYSYSASTGIVTIPESVDANFVAAAISPINKREAIKSICNQAVDKIPAGTKERINTEFAISSTQEFTAELPTFNSTPRKTMIKILDSFPADYLIKPFNETLRIKFMPKILGNEYPEAKFSIPETLFRGKPQISKSSAKSYNIGNIKRPSKVYETKQASSTGNGIQEIYG